MTQSNYLTGSLKNKTPFLFLIVGVLLFLISTLFYFSNKTQFLFSYLTSFTFYMTLTLGSLFFVLIHYLSRAGWSVVLRRVPELFMKNITLMFVLFIPIVLGMYDLYHWTHPEYVIGDHILEKKTPYLNVPFFLIRAVFFFLSWYFIITIFLENQFFKTNLNHLILR